MLVFDLDDTLYLERDFAFSGYDHLENWAHRHLGVTGFGTGCRAQFQAGARRLIFNTVCTELGIPATERLIRTLVEEYRYHPPKISLCADSKRCLSRYAGQSRLGLITDGPAKMQRAKIKALGLTGVFDLECVTGDWPPGQGKPHPRAFIEVETRAATDEPHVYVADNPAKDFVTPKERGWRTIQILRDGAVHDPEPPDARHAAERQITSLDELGEVLARFSG